MLSRALGPWKQGLKLSSSVWRMGAGSVGLQSSHAIVTVRLNSSGPNSGIPPTAESAMGDITSGTDAMLNITHSISSSDGTVVAAEAVRELGYYPVDIAMYAIENLHMYADIPYWQAIVAFTVGIRVILLPIALKGVQNGNRMAHLKPDMEKVQNAMKASEGMSDPKMQARYQMEMKELFKKHNVNPFRALALPFMQMPIFISLFMALRQMQDYFPGYCEGGTLWFTDLSVADPTYVLPVLNAVSFLLMVEVGADGMDQANKGMFKNIMRALAFMMVPLTASMPQVLHCTFPGIKSYFRYKNILYRACLCIGLQIMF